MKIHFEEYNAFPDSDILSVTTEGITLTTGLYIDFTQCAASFRSAHGGSGRCVGERDVSGSDPSIGFYTAPVTTHIVFTSGSKLQEFFRRDSAVARFQKLRRQIEDAGFTTCDMS